MAISRVQPTKNERGDGGFADGSKAEEQEGNAEHSGAAAEENGSSHPHLEPSSEKESSVKDAVAVISVVISQNDARNQVFDLEASHGKVADFSKDEKVEVVVGDAGYKKGCLPRNESYHEQCSAKLFLTMFSVLHEDMLMPEITQKEFVINKLKNCSQILGANVVVSLQKYTALALIFGSILKASGCKYPISCVSD
ncbi:hypothetical protein ACLOJK_004651 [Asimina triloba]